MSSAAPKPATPAPALTKASWHNRLIDALSNEWRVVPVLFTLAIIWIVFGTQSDTFLTPRNLSNLAAQTAVTAILALGLVLVLLVAEIDLSVAALSAVTGAVAGLLVVNAGWSLWPSILAAVIAGGSIGLLQGAVSTIFGAPSFIITLGGSLVLQGALLVLLPPESGLIPLASTPLQGIANTNLPPGLSYGGAILAAVVVGLLKFQTYRARMSQGLPVNAMRTAAVPAAVLVGGLTVAAVFNSYRGVPMPVVILLGLLCVLSYVTTQTRFGTYLLAIGANAEAARRSGIAVVRIKISAFVLLGMLTAVGGVVAASRVLGVSAQSGDSTVLLEAVAAAVIGGASLLGGRGSVWAALIGALVIGSITNGMLLIDASTQTRLGVQGAILILAVVADATIARRSKARH